MRRYSFILPLIISLLVSCTKQDVTLKFDSQPQLTIYAFPTDSATFEVKVTATLPTSGDIPSLDITSVTVTTDGTADKVTLKSSEKVDRLPLQTYVAEGNHKVGSTITVTVTDSKLGQATATTVIPAGVPIQSVESSKTVRDMRNAYLFNLHFTDPDTTNYYAVRITARDSMSLYQEYNDLKIDPSLEPLINHYTEVDLDVWNEYYDNMYFLEDRDIPDHKGSLHLSAIDESRYTSYIVKFYTIVPEYYKMLRSINDQSNNELGSKGFAAQNATYTNVKGGFGCVAGYSVATYSYTKPDPYAN